MVSKDTIPGPHDMVFWTTSIAGLQGTNCSALSSSMINNTSTLVSIAVAKSAGTRECCGWNVQSKGLASNCGFPKTCSSIRGQRRYL